MNKNFSYLRCVIVLFFSLKSLIGFGQNELHNSTGNPAEFANDKHHPRHIEKLYLHLDRNWYKPGDTIWYKAYLLNGNLSASLQSGLLYIDLRNDSNRVVKRQIIKAHNGLAVGDIALKERLAPGNYVLHAYTNWMRNFTPEHFFSCQITIAPSGNQYWLVTKQQTIDKAKNVSLSMHFSDLTPKNIGFRDMQISLLNGNNSYLKNKAITDPYGNLTCKFVLPEKKGHLPFNIQVEDISKQGDNRKILIPVQLSGPENTDLQFMPEGGSLLAGVHMQVGFKAIDENGKGVVGIRGEVFNNTKEPVASFKSMHKGMGSFSFTPQPGEIYTAKVIFADSTTKTYTLPVVKNSGMALHVNNIPGKDSLIINVAATADLMNSGRHYSLMAHSRDSVYYYGDIVLNGKPVSETLSKKIFPTGITKFILIDPANKPVSTRMIFIDHDDQLNISISSKKPSYRTRDSVALQLYITDAAGKPVAGHFSLAVTDNNEIKARDTTDENIKSYMLLGADLKGSLEEPGYYFNKKHKDRAEALDNLLLTQGWANYDWDQCFGPREKLQFDAEPGLRVKGKVSNVFNKPIANTEITLMSEFPTFTLTTMTDNKGCFMFDDFPELEKIDFRIQATRDYNIGLNVDEFVPADFEPIKNPPAPWYVNSDSTFVNYVTNSTRKIPVIDRRTKPDEKFDPGKSKLLKEVVIKKHHYNPPPAVHLLLDEEDLRNARTGAKPLTLMKLLNQKERLNQMFKLLIIDEHPYVRLQELNSISAQWEINEWLNSYTTSDILDMRVERMFMNTKLGETPALSIIITTNAHNGGDMAGNNGYAYHPIPISQPSEFYSPLYSAKTTNNYSDWRSTVYWAPEIITDKDGKATVSFYTADRGGNYSVILEGADMKGNVGYQKQQLKVVR